MCFKTCHKIRLGQKLQSISPRLVLRQFWDCPPPANSKAGEQGSIWNVAKFRLWGSTEKSPLRKKTNPVPFDAQRLSSQILSQCYMLNQNQLQPWKHQDTKGLLKLDRLKELSFHAFTANSLPTQSRANRNTYPSSPSSSQNCIKKLDTNKQQFKQSQSPECSLCVWVSSMCLCGWGGTQYKWDNNYIAANTYIATAAGFLCFVLPYLKKHWVSFVLFYLREEAPCSLLQDLTMKFILKCPSRPTLKCNKLSQCILANLHAGSEMLSALSVRKPQNGMSYHQKFKKWTGIHKILGGAVNWASETQNFLI